MVQNIVLNNSSHAFSAWADGIRADQDQPKVNATPGTAAAIAGDLRSELAAGTLAGMGRGLIANFTA